MQNGSHSNSDHFQAVHAQKTNSMASMMTVYKMMQLSFLPNVTVFKQVICHLSSNKTFHPKAHVATSCHCATAYLNDAISLKVHFPWSKTLAFWMYYFFIWMPKHLPLRGKIPWWSNLEQKIASFGSCGSFFKLSSHNVKQAGLANCRVHKEGQKLNLKSSKYLRLHIDKCVALKPVIQTLRESTGCSVSQDLTCRILLVKLVVRKEPKSHVTRLK